MQAEQAQKEAEQANSLTGIFKNTVSNIFSTAKDYVIGSAKQAIQLETDLVTNPIKTLTKSYNALPDHISSAFGTSFDYGTDTVTQMMQDYKNGTGSTSGDVANLAKLTSAVAGMIFSPVTGTFEAAQEFPVLKQVADAVNVPFTLAGLSGAYATGKVVDIMPIDDASKEVLKKPLEELGSLAAQIFFGGRVMSKLSDTFVTGKPVTVAEANKIVREIKNEHPEVFATEVPTATPSPFFDAIKIPEKAPRVSTKAHELYMKEMGYEPYLPPELLPTIEMGNKPKEGLPTIQIEPNSKKVAGELVYEPIVEKPVQKKGEAPRVIPEPNFSAKVDVKKVEQKVPKVEGGAPAAEVKPSTPIGEGQVRKSTLASKIEANAIENKLVDSFKNLPEYKKVDMKEQAKFATDILNADPAKALRIALGKEAPPPHVLPEMLLKAVEEVAIKNKDVQVLRQLATESTLSLQATAMGQRIRALGERVQDSPVDIIQDIKETRARVIRKKDTKAIDNEINKIAKEIKREIKKEASKRQSWEEFIQEVQCKF